MCYAAIVTNTTNRIHLIPLGSCLLGYVLWIAEQWLYVLVLIVVRTPVLGSDLVLNS